MNIKITALVLIIALSHAPQALAQSSTPTVGPLRQARQELNEKRKEIKEDWVEKKDELKQEKLDFRTQLKQKIEDIKEKAKELSSEFRFTRAKNTAARIRARLVARFDFISKVKVAIEQRFVKIDEANKTAATPRDLTAARAQLAKFDVTKYNAALKNLDDVIAKISIATNPKTLLPEINQAAKAVHTELNTLHQVLVDTLKAVPKKKE